MMCSIVLYIHVKNEKSVRAVLEKSPKHTIFRHLNPHNPRLKFFSEKTLVSFEILWRTTLKTLGAVLEKNWSVTTN